VTVCVTNTSINHHVTIFVSFRQVKPSDLKPKTLVKILEKCRADFELYLQCKQDRQCTYKCNIEVSSSNRCCFVECVSVTLVIQHE
jgi:hypothetical protein